MSMTTLMLDSALRNGMPDDLPVLPAPHLRVLTVTTTDALGSVWPLTALHDDSFEVEDTYAGNAHMEAVRAGVLTCFDMHPDDPRPCVACEVEEGSCVMVTYEAPAPVALTLEDVIAGHMDSRFPVGMAVSIATARHFA